MSISRSMTNPSAPAERRRSAAAGLSRLISGRESWSKVVTTDAPCFRNCIAKRLSSACRSIPRSSMVSTASLLCGPPWYSGDFQVCFTEVEAHEQSSAVRTEVAAIEQMFIALRYGVDFINCQVSGAAFGNSSALGGQPFIDNPIANSQQSGSDKNANESESQRAAQNTEEDQEKRH